VPAGSRGEPWLRAVWQELLETLMVLQRLLFIFLLFTPVVASAPLALALDFKRAEWLELLRKSLEAAGGPAGAACTWGVLGRSTCFGVAGAGCAVAPEGVQRLQPHVPASCARNGPHQAPTAPAGPAFIKWGQWAATRLDMFPPDFCRWGRPALAWRLKDRR
jgi:hypothetical protein